MHVTLFSLFFACKPHATENMCSNILKSLQFLYYTLNDSGNGAGFVVLCSVSHSSKDLMQRFLTEKKS